MAVRIRRVRWQILRHLIGRRTMPLVVIKHTGLRPGLRDPISDDYDYFRCYCGAVNERRQTLLYRV